MSQQVVEPLVYHNGKEMSFRPSNASLDDIRSSLVAGLSTMAILEPGDATRYHLFISPVWAIEEMDLSAFGIPRTEAHNYLFVSKLSSRECRGCWINRTYPIGAHDFADITDNGWSQTFLACWFNVLVAEIAKAP